MKKVTRTMVIFALAGAMLVSNLGCIMGTQNRVRYRELAGKQKAQAEEWLHSANLLCNVKDYDFALEYYKKIVTYYPYTEYAKKAQAKIEEIEKTTD